MSTPLITAAFLGSGSSDSINGDSSTLVGNNISARALMLFPTNVLLSPLMLSLLPEPKNAAVISGVDKSSGQFWHRAMHSVLAVISTLSHGFRGKVTALITIVLVVVSIGHDQY